MTPLESTLRFFIENDGPIPLVRVMELSNRHYYATRDPLGAAGDFTTAPEISQVFGELVGIWAAMVWHGMDRPAAVNLVELGPGRGTLMADALRAIGSVPGMRNALHVHLVETSPALRQRQTAALEPFRVALDWHDDVSTLPNGPLIVIANEFFDALPVHQYVRRPEGWREHVVGLKDGALALGLSPGSVPPNAVPTALRDCPIGSVAEVCPAAIDVMAALADRIARHGGGALVVDYGHAASGAGDTLQAVRGHAHVDPLVDLGEADLTAHVDFAALAQAARAMGAEAHSAISQRDLLLGLGIEARTAMLAANADPDAAERLRTATERLIDPAPLGMGTLFKALAVTAPGLPVPPPFPQSPEANP